MNEIQFWKYIKLIDNEALSDGDEEGAIAPLQEAINSLDIREIYSFDDNLSKLLYDLDGEKYAAQSGESGDSGDGFLYLRCWVVAQGELIYYDILKNPKKMPKSTDQWCESLLYVAQFAWAKREKLNPSEYPHEAKHSSETGSNEKNW